ncbi:MAG: HAMP domain-containing histidine kinase [Anaeromyxobacter sp.]|nr:HAMP domain-containing histidine kinase [Anaeromyxobacter sp.]
MTEQPDGGAESREHEERLRARAAFIRDLAHEVSTPLTPLAGYLKILQTEKLGPLSAQQRRVMETMAVCVARLTRIVENLGDFASLGSERAPLTPGPVDPDLLAELVIEELRPFIKDARLNVVLARAGGGPVLADARKLKQALMNVVGNAVKFSPHGAEVLVEVSREGGRLRFAVYDQGPGVAAAEAAAIFEPFHHAQVRASDEARHHPGSGLGLPVARRIAEAHGGRVWLESPPRTQPPVALRHFAGCRFTIEIPDIRPDQAPPAEAAAPPAGPR